MRNLVWAGMFLLLTIVASTVAAAAMIGMPIAGAVQFGAADLTIVLVGWGIVNRGTCRAIARNHVERPTRFRETIENA